jgi:hypothetical protein
MTPAPFQFDTAATQLVNNSTPTITQLGVSGGDSAGGVVEASRWGGQSAPDSSIPDFFRRMLEPRMAAKRQKAFYEGAAQARAGRTMQEINKDVPWLARIFGPTNYQAGAAVFTGQAAAAEMTRDAMENMDELKTYTPKQMGDWLSDRARTATTGDVVADAAIQKALFEQSGPLMELQTKNSMAWKQTELNRTQYEAWMGAARLHNTTARGLWQFGQENPNEPPNEATARENDRLLFEALIPPDGQTFDSFVDNFGKMAEQAGREGLWHPLSRLLDSEYIQQLPSEKQVALESRLQTVKNRWLQGMQYDPSTEDAAKIRMANAAGIDSAETSVAKMLEFNKKFTASTGYPDPYFDNDEIEAAAVRSGTLVFQAHQRMLDEQARAREAAATAEAKAAAEAQEDAKYAQAGMAGTLGVMSNLAGYDKVKAESAVMHLMAGNPAAGLAALKSNFDSAQQRWTSDRFKEQIANRVASGAGMAWNESFDQTYKLWHSMFYMQDGNGMQDPSGMDMANVYFDKYADDMFMYDGLLKANVPQEAAYLRVFGPEATFGAGDLRGGAGTKENEAALKDAAMSFVSDSNNVGLMKQWFGGDTSESAVEFIAHKASKHFERLLKQTGGSMTPKQLAGASIRWFQSNGGEVAGKFAWMNSPQQKPLAQTLGVPADVFGAVMDEAVTNRMRKAGLSVDSASRFETLRIPDDAAGPRVVVMGYDKDGGMKLITLGGKDFDALKKKYVEEAAPAAQAELSEALNRLGRSQGRNW